ncbi:polyprenyl synthetase family protein [Bacillus sp. CGMCC 1.16607]|uniref:polyprenyl synthetase family protein n=1 Tax=Bacillus sp. CGMCC 1.16607 TaxID=3351842 RepID=UPI00364262EE
MRALLLPEFSERFRSILEEELKRRTLSLNAPTIIKDAMLYSLEAGGKRIRPLLLFATIHAFNKDSSIGLDTAVAIEMIHTYSLIHDDLPCMDDDDLRRGKPTNHKVFGEAIAVLAGDALLTYSFQVITETSKEIVSNDIKLELIKELAKAAGSEGMVGGQVADMEAEGKRLDLSELEYIHIHKTGKLLAFSILAGAIISEATEIEKKCLTNFAHHLGLAFQIQDDILDLEGDQEIIGKPVGSDQHNNKNTYPSLLTIEGAKKALQDHIKEAKRNLVESGLNTDLLAEITNLIASRDH